MPYTKEAVRAQLRPDLPKLRSGHIVKVYQKIREGEKERIQIFEGQIISIKHGTGVNATMTVRRIASGVGVERIFPIHSPLIAKIEIVKNARARKAKLYYTRSGKTAKIKSQKAQK